MKCIYCKRPHQNTDAETGAKENTCWNCMMVVKSLHAYVEATNRFQPPRGKRRILTIESFSIRAEE